MRYHHFLEWDPRKSANNKAKHHVSFEDAAAVLRDPQAEIYHIERFDHENSLLEERFVTLGSHPARRNIVLFICWTMRRGEGRDVTRIISARRATPHEKREYDREIAER